MSIDRALHCFNMSLQPQEGTSVSECYEDILPGPRSFLKVFEGYDFVFYSKG